MSKSSPGHVQCSFDKPSERSFLQNLKLFRTKTEEVEHNFAFFRSNMFFHEKFCRNIKCSFEISAGINSPKMANLFALFSKIFWFFITCSKTYMFAEIYCLGAYKTNYRLHNAVKELRQKAHFFPLPLQRWKNCSFFRNFSFWISSPRHNQCNFGNLAEKTSSQTYWHKNRER